MSSLGTYSHNDLSPQGRNLPSLGMMSRQRKKLLGKKSPFLRVNVSLKLNIPGGHPLEEKCSLPKGDISLEMKPRGKTSPQGQRNFKEFSFSLKETSYLGIQRHLPEGSYIAYKGKTFLGVRFNKVHKLN